MNIFERASRAALRFQTPRGSVATDDLWQMPLSSADGFNLDDVAKRTHKRIKEADEESFVQTSDNPTLKQDELRLEILKHVIASKLAAKQAAETRAARAAERNKLMEILERKQTASLEELSEEELKAKLDELSAA